MCVIGGTAFFIHSETVDSVCRFEMRALKTNLGYKLNLKSMFGVTSANLRCLGDRVAVFGRAANIIKFILIDPISNLIVQNRIRALMDIDATGVKEIRTSTSTNRVFLTVVRNTFPKFEFFSVNKNGIRRFYFKGSSEPLNNRSFFAVQVSSSIPDQTLSYSFNMNLSRKVYSKGDLRSNITYIGKHE